MIRSSLFSEGGWGGGPSLAGVLEAHQRASLNKIKEIARLDDLSEPFLNRMVTDSLVKPLVLHFDRMTHKMRTESIDAAYFPPTFLVERGKSYPRSVARISIPFDGDAHLFKYCPSEFRTTFPNGEIWGQTLQFDVVLLGHQDDDERTAKDIAENRQSLEFYIERVNKQVQQFNASVPANVQAVFAEKLKMLERQYAMFDRLGIQNEEQQEGLAIKHSSKPTKQRRPKAEQIVQYVENQFVQQLTQINNNVGGDVNNAIQSD